MTNLQQAISSGQVSAAQVEAHRVAGDLPIVMIERHEPQTLRDVIDGATDESAHVLCKVSDVRKALDDAAAYAFIRANLIDSESSVIEDAFDASGHAGKYPTENEFDTVIRAAIKATS